MPGDVLSRTEIESLLGPEGAAAEQARGRSLAGRASPLRPREKITPYDFKRPERVGKDQMRALQTLHEGFGRNFGAALSAMLRTIVEVKLTAVDQLTYAEFVFGLDNPTCFNLLKAEPLDGNLILDISPSILYPMIDRLLGGGKDSSVGVRRALTEIELRLVGRITRLFLDELHKAWENLVHLKLEVVRVESNPQLVQIVPPNEVVILLSFELAMGELRGMINLCIPFNAIESIGNQLSSNNWASYNRRPATPESIKLLERRLRGAKVELVVDLARTRISTRDLIGLRIGDIITTEQDVQSLLLVSLCGLTKFQARPGALKGRKAICIESVLQQPD
jgi:flagellar motor switch protein FliM